MTILWLLLGGIQGLVVIYGLNLNLTDPLYWVELFLTCATYLLGREIERREWTRHGDDCPCDYGYSSRDAGDD